MVPIWRAVLSKHKKMSKSESLDELQDDYYKISAEEYMNFAGPKPVGYIFHS